MQVKKPILIYLLIPKKWITLVNKMDRAHVESSAEEVFLFLKSLSNSG